MTYYRHAETGSVHDFNHLPTPADQWERMTDKDGAAAYKAQTLAELRAMLPPGSTVYTVLRHRSASGMSRSISCHAVADGRIVGLDWYVARATGRAIDQKNGGVKVGGCGMDVGFHLVYTISRALYPDGFGTEGKRTNGRTVRPASAKHAARLVKAGATFYGRNGDASGWDKDGGYALKQTWL